MLQLYKNIRNRRMELNMTQSELAAKMGYADKSMIAKIEKGLVDLPQSKIFAFAKALDTSAADLVGWDEAEENKDLSNSYMMADLMMDEELLSYIEKIKNISESGKNIIYGYIDCIYEKEKETGA